jgi:hypothetical protein
MRFFPSFYGKELVLYSGLVFDSGMTYAGYLYNIIDSPSVNTKIKYIKDYIGQSISREVVLSKNNEILSCYVRQETSTRYYPVMSKMLVTD